MAMPRTFESRLDGVKRTAERRGSYELTIDHISDLSGNFVMTKVFVGHDKHFSMGSKRVR